MNLNINQRCYLSFQSKLLTVGEAKPVGIPNRILQTPLLTHFARICQQPRLSLFESSVGNWVNQNIVDLKKFKAVEKNCKGELEPKGNFSVQSEHEIEFIFRFIINPIRNFGKCMVFFQELSCKFIVSFGRFSFLGSRILSCVNALMSIFSLTGLLNQVN